MTATTTRYRKVGSRPPQRLPSPDLIADDELAGLLREYERLTEERRKADRAAIAARDGGIEARKRDAADQAAAMRDGLVDPGDAHERKRLDDLTKARSRVEAIDAARLSVARDIQRRRVDARDDLLAALDAKRADLDGRVDKALDVLRAAVEEAKALRQLRKWVEPETLDNYSPPAPGRGDPSVKVGGRLGGYAFEPRQVFEALARALRT